MNLEIEDELYEISPELIDFLQNEYQDNAIRIVNIFNHLSKLNDIFHNRYKIFLDKLDTRLVSLIVDSTTTTSAVEDIEIYLKRAIDAYLRRYYIYIDLDMVTPYDLEELLGGLETLFYLDIPTSEELIVTIENDLENNVEKMAFILSEYTNLTNSFLFDIIDNVDDVWFTNMSMFYRAKLHRGYEEVNTEDLTKIGPLLQLDNNFTSSTIIKEVLYYGFTVFNFNQYVDTLYRNIRLCLDDVDGIVLEIVATNYLSSDQPITTVTQLEELINFKALDHIDYKTASRTVIPKVIEYIEQLKGIVHD